MTIERKSDYDNDGKKHVLELTVLWWTTNTQNTNAKTEKKRGKIEKNIIHKPTYVNPRKKSKKREKNKKQTNEIGQDIGMTKVFPRKHMLSNLTFLHFIILFFRLMDKYVMVYYNIYKDYC